MIHRARLLQAVKDAKESFWASVAASFPEVKTGDFPAIPEDLFDTACFRAVEQWVHLNVPQQCGFPSSVSDAVCVLPAGHAADSPFRFHRFTKEERVP